MAKPDIKVNKKKSNQHIQVNDEVKNEHEEVKQNRTEVKDEQPMVKDENKQEGQPVTRQESQRPVNQQPTSNINNVKTLEELFEVARAKGYGTIASRLERRINLFKRQHSEQEELAANYDLYNLIVEVLKTPNRNQFKEKFDIINKAFLLGKDNYFKPTNLVRYDYLWQWGVKSKQQYELLVYAISKLANPGNRHIELKRIDLSKAVDGLPEVVKRNFISYYREGA